ncbi:MAG TPA: hypothetical protein H9894_02085 [Candidatus Desulfovibrio intestinipullorum]|uniref:Lipoprotein n=1 Tax=Candidatus Desulfovibrio intestinipullorum TaxID=2838536 RepID=A0A9D1PVQ9_9BACT|nr:hypothetical protein [Candidatus Desulfovibrio intestinipullorum]
MQHIRHAGLILCLWSVLLLAGCAQGSGRSAEVVDNGEYARLIRLFPKQMQAQGLADTGLAYHDAGKPDGQFGTLMFDRLSPDFLFNEKGHHIYLGATFHQTLTPSSRVYPDRDGQGFAIVHPSQRLAMRMLAVVDWNRDDHDDWLMRCTVETFRGNRVRHYYVLAPAPSGREMTHGTILASVEEMGLARPILQARDMSGYGRSEDELPPTVVEDALPGERPVTAPPTHDKSSGGVQERDI